MSQKDEHSMRVSVKVPDEIWFNLLQLNRPCCRGGGFLGSIRLFDGQVLDNMIVSDRGYLLGRIASGIEGAHGDIDSSMLTFRSEDIVAVQVPAFRFWQRPKWVSLGREHPLRAK